MNKTEENIKVKSLYKAIKLLDYFVSSSTEIGVTELSKKTGMLKSSVHNILSTFEVCGIVERNPQTSRYHLGAKVLEYSNHFYQNNDIRKIIRPSAEELAELTGETIYIAKLFNYHVIYLDAVYPKACIGGRNVIGIRADAYCTGLGKALLAYQELSIIDDVIGRGLVAYTKNTITDPKSLMKELELIRQRGYAIDNMEHEHGIKCVAVPLFNIAGQVVSAMSISGPSLRFGENKIKEYIKVLLEISKKYSNILM